MPSIGFYISSQCFVVNQVMFHMSCLCMYWSLVFGLNCVYDSFISLVIVLVFKGVGFFDGDTDYM